MKDRLIFWNDWSYIYKTVFKHCTKVCFSV